MSPDVTQLSSTDAPSVEAQLGNAAVSGDDAAQRMAQPLSVGLRGRAGGCVVLRRDDHAPVWSFEDDNRARRYFRPVVTSADAESVNNWQP